LKREAPSDIFNAANAADFRSQFQPAQVRQYDLRRFTGGNAAYIRAYFDFFIKLHRRRGMPGPGCFCGNVMAELASHDVRVRDVIVDHMRELQSAFLHALLKEVDQRGCTLAPVELESMAHFLATASQGLWARARSLTEVGELTRYKETLMALLASHLDRCALDQSNSRAATVDRPSGQR